ncbi:UNVERIFIED_CONTAM: hypothetical protein PYX00_008261 [Menopon gallinae]|uniref:15-hydroxyprostaglandin dehydrogenase [NAD(+)] n=1 Tax=Menopon gallinae TaxID=328185 RepID=A0AAW2HNI4_9NEOP
MDFADKAAIVTGGASGIGKAIVEELLKNGAKVAICDIDEENGEKLARQLVAKHGKEKVIFCECDVTDYPQFEESFDTVVETFGSVDIVVNNAGIMNDRLWELEVDVNLVGNGVIRGTLLALRYMGKDRGGKGGVLVNIGSNCSLKPYTSAPIYSATKHAIIGLTRAYGDSYHLSTTGVRVFAFCPSATDTGLIKDIRKQLLSADYEKAWLRDTHNSLIQKSEHVARALVQCLPTAPSGSVWAVENSQPPRQVDYSNT